MAFPLLLAVLVTFLAFPQSTHSYCFPESERKTLTFANDSTNEMTHLPTIRFIQGYWATQWVTQYMAKIYLEEKMGVKTEFYPLLSSGLTVADTIYDYPEFYYALLVDDSYDVLFEMWFNYDLYIEYFDSGYLINGGNSNVYGEVALYVPEYVFDENPDWVSLANLRSNETLRQIFEDAYTTDSDTNWLEFIQEKLQNTSSAVTTEYLEEGFSLPLSLNESTSAKPIAWGSSFHYTMNNIFANNFVQKVEIYNTSSHEMDVGLDWQFIPLGSESQLTELFVELYENKLPFIVNLYSPHTDFSIISNRTGEYMAFQKVTIKRNADNSLTTECYTKHQCNYPIKPLYKMGNSRLSDSFPEIKQFLFDFHILNSDVEDVLALQTALAQINPNMTDSEKWFNATCTWLRSINASKTVDWYQEITRYDCTSFENGCGFSEYYSDSSLGTLVLNGAEIGGYCANSSSGPECVCTNEYLAGDDCRTNCDGLIIYYSADDEEYEFIQCYGHGTCDINHHTCTCDAGYAGDACDIVFEEFVYDLLQSILWIVLLCFIITVNIASVVWMYKQKKYKTIRAIGIQMTALYTLGMVLICLSSIFYVYHPVTNFTCIGQNYCVGIGAVLTIMCPLLKTYRINAIFNSRKMRMKIIPDSKLSVYLLIAMLFEVIVCSVYAVLHQISGGVRTEYLMDYNRVETKCNGSSSVIYLWNANYLFIVGLTVILAYFSFCNHKPHIAKVFQDTKCAYFGSFFSLFVFLVVVVFFLVTDDSFIRISIYCSGISIAAVVVWVLFWPEKIYSFYADPENRNIVDIATDLQKKRISKSKTSDCSPTIPKFSAVSNIPPPTAFNMVTSESSNW